ncbi:molecular chaperone HscC [Amphritea atlantica]|uniref:Molecular chaperone HscC n=1 Tax=Amphritea atlantica TaxID=355243 RepID=A0A1H9FXR6_9GAMM|nr:molecular chaperone HscC [Amphritea atlantica]SEQ42691.1 molecular chaperone HscC [Amphritea atlantica]
MTILGIDLGTTNSACAIWKDGKTTLIPNQLNEFLTPSVIGIDQQGEILVGLSASHRLISHPASTVAVFKRYMGTDYTIDLGKRSFTAAELSSLILRSLKEDAEAYLGETITQAVISVPAYFNDVQRKATKLAAELAGLNVDRLINEPTAAAMVYGLHDKRDGVQFLILDLGGGTFDVSLVEYFDGVIEVHASSGDNRLGGEDFLEMLVNHYFEKTGIAKRSLTANELQRVYAAMEGAKRKLSSEREIVIEQAVKSQLQPFRLSREEFDRIVHPLLHRIQLPIERTLRDAGVSPAEIDEVVLVGGATRMFAFRSLITRMFRRMPAANIDPDLVVAMGAGIQAGLKEKHADLDDVVLTDVAPYTLGVEIHNEGDKNDKQGGLFMPIIERNSIVPVSIERTLYTVCDNQKIVSINVYQGESRLVKNNVNLGELEVRVPPAKAGEESVNVRYSYDMNGLLDVDVTVNSTGLTQHTTIINSASGLTDKEIEQSREKLAKLKFHPREQAENRVLIARAERLYECSLGDKRDYISNLLSHFELVLEKQNPVEIKKVTAQFSEMLDGLEEDNLFS